MELFRAQPPEVRNAILLPDVGLRLAVEAASAFGWKALTGDSGHEHCLEDFGESAPMEELQKKYGFLPDALADRMARLVG